MAKAPKSVSLTGFGNTIINNYTVTAQTGQPVGGTFYTDYVSMYGPELFTQTKKSAYPKRGSYEWLERNYPTVYKFVCANGISEDEIINAYILWKTQSDALLTRAVHPSATREDITNYENFKFSTFMFDNFSYKEDPDIVYE